MIRFRSMDEMCGGAVWMKRKNDLSQKKRKVVKVKYRSV